MLAAAGAAAVAIWLTTADAIADVATKHSLRPGLRVGQHGGHHSLAL
jgi:hypothetical protein